MPKPPQVSWFEYAKKALIAVFAFAVAIVGSLIVAVTAGSDGGTSITAQEWLQAAWVGLSAIGGTLGIYVAGNKHQ